MPVDREGIDPRGPEVSQILTINEMYFLINF